MEEASDDEVSNTFIPSRLKATVKEQSPDESNTSLSIKKTSPLREVPAAATPTTTDIFIPATEAVQEKTINTPKIVEEETVVKTIETSSTEEMADEIQDVLEKAEIAQLSEYIELQRPTEVLEAKMTKAHEGKLEEVILALEPRDRKKPTDEAPIVTAQLNKPIGVPVPEMATEAKFKTLKAEEMAELPADHDASVKLGLPNKRKPVTESAPTDEDRGAAFIFPSSRNQPDLVQSPEVEFRLASQPSFKLDTDEELSESLSLSKPRPKRRSLDEEMKEVQSAENSLTLPGVKATPVDEPVVEALVFTKGISERMAYEEEEDVEIVVITNGETSVQWFFAGEVITQSEKYTIFKDGVVHKLIIRKVRKSEAGRYTCKSETVETSGTIVVHEKPVKFEEPLVDQTVTLGK